MNEATPVAVRPDRLHARRARVMDAMAARGGGIALLATAPERLRNRDNDYPYRHDSSFYYLTGFTEPDALLVMVAARDGARRTVLFCRDRNPEREIWDGYRHGPDAARVVVGADEAMAISELDVRLPDLLADQPALWRPLVDAALAQRAERALEVVRARSRTGVRAPAAVIDLLPVVDELRLVKDDAEIATMRRACDIAAAAHLRAMRCCRPGLREHHLEAELLHAFRSAGAQSPAYNAIVAAGANACVLHYRAADAELRAGELCLIDAGCELDSYASDVTRSFPVDGRFGGPQRAVYELVLAAQAAAIDATRPGVPYNVPHGAAVRVLAQGLVDLGLLAGSVDGAIESGAYRQFYMHKTGHWLGLDVHDVGDYRDPSVEARDGAERPWRALMPGMVVTVEPGLYLRPAANVPPAFENIGVRIEDDVLVTTAGVEVLSQAAPKRIDDVEALMRDASSRARTARPAVRAGSASVAPADALRAMPDAPTSGAPHPSAAASPVG